MKVHLASLGPKSVFLRHLHLNSNINGQTLLKVVGQVISQRCLETGVSEVYLDVSDEDKTKEKMVKFIDVIEQSGLSLSEANVYMPTNPHISNHRQIQPKRLRLSVSGSISDPSTYQMY